ncbi:MAG: hypothetical protein WCK47_05820 [bacterium]|nr:hypothetical protein [Candidatus Sumerlaeota bacterium]
MSQPMTPAQLPPLKKRVESVDAFRGFTIFAMIFVIMVAGYRNLPLTFPHFGSAPVSTFKHASEDAAPPLPREWAFWQGLKTSDPPLIYYAGKLLACDTNSSCTVAVLGDKDTTLAVVSGARIRAAKPLRPGEEVIARSLAPAPPRSGVMGEPVSEYAIRPDSFTMQGTGNGCTFCDLVAPFFVFIVGVCIPLSKRKRGAEWWRHVGFRTLSLILAGVLYISLILKLSWWWGILQAIGAAYFMGAVAMFLPVWGRWTAIAVIAAFHAWMSWHVPWWLELGDKTRPFFTIANLHGDPLRPLTVHCTPWASISWGIIAIAGTLIGDAVAGREPRAIIRQCLVVGVILTAAGWLLHIYQAPMNKDYVSPAYSVFTSGLGALCYLVFYLLIDAAGLKLWAWPFTVFGANALLAYFMQPVVRIFFQALGLYPFFTSHAGWNGVLWGLIWTTCLWVVVLWCNKKNIYWKL